MAWTPVQVMVLRMSATVQPLERSLTGCVSPVMMGPRASAPVDCCTACAFQHESQFTCDNILLIILSAFLGQNGEPKFSGWVALSINLLQGTSLCRYEASGT